MKLKLSWPMRFLLMANKRVYSILRSIKHDIKHNLLLFCGLLYAANSQEYVCEIF